MVREQIADRGVTNITVLAAMRRVPRHEFVPASWRNAAYSDRPLPIGSGQTISQPYIVGLMTELLELKAGDKVLEVGTGSGYQAAILAEITTNVYTIEIVQPLYEEARKRLSKRKFESERVRHGDGYYGLAERAPFDAIIVTAAADHIPPPLLKQLKPGGRMVLPIGPVHTTQRLVLVEKDDGGKVRTKSVLPVQFVPLTGGPQTGESRP
ncbi:MAG: protein-L-isoaspartate(D-aspartate) O-methyltransferase [Verrucomicrobia bacterium]|nr:protein-L-isoaspartate(D-aspartate) O-methyltransferase [Verrucomicrobiota bacterium]